jgi:hypothetical protein
VSLWFRFYTGVVDDPKAQMLSPEMFKHWVNVLCIAAKHDGELPAISATAFTLRLAETKAAGILAKLHTAGLLDKTEKSFKPHNWDGRQFKSDKPDETAAERMRNYRERKRNSGHVTPHGVTRNVTEPVTRNVTVPRTDTDSEQKEDGIGDARASKFTEGSKALATTFLKALGFDTPLKVPPEFAGTDWRAIGWEHAGWTVDLIDAETRRIGPDKPLTYYEKVFATSFAKRQAPLPIVEVRAAEKVTVNHGTSQNRSGGSLTASLRRDLAALEQSDGPDNSLPAGRLLRLSN